METTGHFLEPHVVYRTRIWLLAKLASQCAPQSFARLHQFDYPLFSLIQIVLLLVSIKALLRVTYCSSTLPLFGTLAANMGLKVLENTKSVGE